MKYFYNSIFSKSGEMAGLVSAQSGLADGLILNYLQPENYQGILYQEAI